MTPNDVSLKPILILSQESSALKSTLEELAYPQIIATSEQDLLTYYLKQQASLVILENAQVCSQLRSQITAPILLLTHRQDLDAALEAGSDEYFLLPIHPSWLLQRVKNLLKASLEAEQRQLAESLLETANALSISNDLDNVLDMILASSSRIVPNVVSSNIMLRDGDSLELVRHHGYENFGLDSIVKGLRYKINETDNLRYVIENRKALVIPDIPSSSLQWADSATSRHVKSVVSAPIILENEVIGVINLDSGHAGTFNQSHAHILQAFANQAAIAVQRAQLFEQIQTYTQDLEKRVARRTEELSQVQSELDNERQLLRTIIDTLPDSVYVKDRESRFILVNRAFLNYTGIQKFSDVIGKSDFDLYPEIAQSMRDNEIRIMSKGEAQINQVEYDYNQGKHRYLLITKVPFEDTLGEMAGIVGINHDISDIKQTEITFEQVIRGARCLLWAAEVTIDENGEYFWELQIVNEPAASSFFVLDSSDRSYTNAWLDAIYPEDKVRRDVIFRTHLQFQKPNFKHEFRLILRDGSQRWLSEDVLIRPLDDEHWTLIGVCMDITERKEAEKRLQDINEELELRVQARTLDLSKANQVLRKEIVERKRAEESERHQRVLAEALRDSIAKLSSSLDRDTVLDYLLSVIRPIVPHDAANIMLMDEDSERMLIVKAWGYDRDLLGTSYLIKDFPAFQAVLSTAQPFIIPNTRQYEFWRNVESNSWILSNVTVPIRFDEAIIGFLKLDSGVADNFSQEQVDWLLSFAAQAGIAIRNARYASELELLVQERTEALAAEQAQLKAILNAMRDGLVYSDMQRRPIYLNQSLVEITGYSQEEWLSGIAQKEMNQDSDENLQELWTQIDKILAYQGYWSSDTSLKHKDGHTFDVHLVRTAVKNAAGERVGIVTVVRDISEEKRLQEQKSRFITVAAHELRTPLTNLKTRIFLMKRQPERFLTHVEVIEKAVNWMHSLIEDMFDISRFERGVINLNQQDVELQTLLSKSISFHQAEAERLEVQLSLEASPNPVHIYADENRLTQVFSNLIANALRHTPNGGEILVQLSQENSSAVIRITDTGKGIPPEHLPHIFEPFYRATESGKGAGLGLAVVKELLELHQGAISVSSEEGQGASFVIDLPLYNGNLID